MGYKNTPNVLRIFPLDCSSDSPQQRVYHQLFTLYFFRCHCLWGAPFPKQELAYTLPLVESLSLHYCFIGTETLITYKGIAIYAQWFLPNNYPILLVVFSTLFFIAVGNWCYIILEKHTHPLTKYFLKNNFNTYYKLNTFQNFLILHKLKFCFKKLKFVICFTVSLLSF